MFRKFACGIVAVSFVLSATELHQLLQLPVLVAHYRTHWRLDNSVSFGEFLQLHYTDSHPDDKDDGDDRELPFKSAGSIQHLDQSRIHALTLAITAPVPLPVRFRFCPDQGDPVTRTEGIFHPPQTVA